MEIGNNLTLMYWMCFKSHIQFGEQKTHQLHGWTKSETPYSLRSSDFQSVSTLVLQLNSVYFILERRQLVLGKRWHVELHD